jgi:hypothetical protein
MARADTARGAQPSPLLIVLTTVVAVFATATAVRYLDQPLLEAHAFRQTQTALTSFWMMQEGWQLAYQTPVGGYPWAIPFEFPIYQALAAGIAGVGRVSLDAVGRILSFMFLIGCAWPAWRIARRLALPPRVVWVFCALLWSSPTYLFWGRSFMIETAALFFAFAAVAFTIDLVEPHPRWSSALGAAAFGTLALLQKITTAGPILAILACVWFGARLRRPVTSPSRGEHTKALIAFGIPLLLAAAWTLYSEQVRALNPLGAQLSSSELRQWTFGTLDQKWSLATYVTVVWQRVFVQSAGGVLGAALLLGALTWPNAPRMRLLLLTALGGFFAPIVIFTNLHLVHDYYQASCVLFLTAALAVAVAEWLPRVARHDAAPLVATCLLVISNLLAFDATYGGAIRASFHEDRDRTLAMAKVLRESTPTNSAFIAFGNDWSSDLAYYAQRKSFTVPAFFRDYSTVWMDPARFVGGAPLAAIVTCPATGGPTIEDVEQRARLEATWHLVRVVNCRLLIRKDGDH